ncbi:WD40-repeat-containing domain protein [Lineolata rhizophorae]|uniref:WD40-repeat-containing domain protein n=1 Tax=Lineolata rhizophorae TaxID=578093 RepID=A0A6A6NRB5_9PEZI|nr:WD40-repeat-containing domain protein [Lineolata rhizophorae]
MDIHRSRFVPYPPSAINAIAFSHPNTDGGTGSVPKDLRLAIGRANGNIEIWNPARGSWVHETTFFGGRDRSVEGLAWTQDPDENDEGSSEERGANDGDIQQKSRGTGRLRLFSIGYSSTVTEWNLSTGLPLRHSSGNYSEVWCLAAQPRLRGSVAETREADQAGQDLVIGCADGTLAILSTVGGELSYKKRLPRATKKRSRVLSVTYQGRRKIVAGYADSTMRIFDTRHGGSLLRTINFGSGPTFGKDTLVWAVKCLSDGTIVSGDSSGELRIFDGKTYGQVQSFAKHEADILCLAASEDGSMIFSGGMDRRTCAYKVRTSRGRRTRFWAPMSYSRYHEHDVKAMASFESKTLSLLVSGGIDGSPIVVPIRNYQEDFWRTLSNLPPHPQIASILSKRLVLSWWDREIHIYHVSHRVQDGSTGELIPPKEVAKLFLKGEESITSVSASTNNALLAVATVADVKIFALPCSELEEQVAVRVQKLKIPERLATRGSRLLQFSPDGKWLALVNIGGSVSLARLIPDEKKKSGWTVVPTLVDLLRQERDEKTISRSTLGYYERTITQLEFSPDSSVLVAGDLAGYLDSWNIVGHEDPTAELVGIPEANSSTSSADDDDDDDDERAVIILGQHWMRNPAGHLLPRLPGAPIVFSFRPPVPGPQDTTTKPVPNGNPAVHPTRRNPHPHAKSLPDGQHLLFVVTMHHEFFEFDILAGRLSDWSRRNPTRAFPGELQKARDRAVGCLWDVNDKWQRAWLYGVSWLFMLDVSQDFRSATESKGSKKRKRQLGIKDEELRETVSGAGSRIPEHKLVGLTRTTIKEDVYKPRDDEGGEVAAERHVQIKDRPEEAVDEDIDIADDKPDDHDSVADDEEAAAHRLLLGSLDDEASTAPHSDGIDENADDDVLHRRDEHRRQVSAAPAGTAAPPPTRKWWCTYKFRPILGIAALGDGHVVGMSRGDGGGANAAGDGARGNGGGGGGDGGDGGDGPLPLEVVVVERPIWDVDLPPRFVGRHERED